MKRILVVAVVVVLAFVAGGYVGWAWVPHPHQPAATPQAAPPPQSSEEPGVFYLASSSGSRVFQLPKDYRITAAQALVIAGAPVANGGFTQNAFSATIRTDIPPGETYEVIRTGDDGRQQTIRFDPLEAESEKIVYLRPRDVIRIRSVGG